MLQLKSNVRDLIGKLNRFKKGMPEAVQKVADPDALMDPAGLMDYARYWAEQTLLPLALDPKERLLYPIVLDAISITLSRAGRAVLKIDTGQVAARALPVLMAYDKTRRMTPADLPADREQMRELVRDWVREEKDTSTDRSTRQAQSAVMAILFGRRSVNRDLARDSLLYGRTGQHGMSIAQFHQQRENARLLEMELRVWIEKIIQKWSGELMRIIEVRMSQAIRELQAKI